MYISCPKCDTKFIVNQNDIGPEGRRVKCSRCSHIWLQRHNNKTKIEPLLTSTPIEDIKLGNGVNLPALLPIKIPVSLQLSFVSNYPYSTHAYCHVSTKSRS